MMVVASELLPEEVRGLGLGLTYSTFWVVAFVEEQTLQSTFKALSVAGTFTLYCGTSCLTLVFVYCCIPETSGLSLEGLGQGGMEKLPSAPASGRNAGEATG